MDSRRQLRELIHERKVLNNKIECVKKVYLDEYEGQSVLFISDHAIIRYIERVIGDELSHSHLGDKDTIAKYVYGKGMTGYEFRNQILTVEEQRLIIKSNITFFKKGEWVYIIRDYTLTTIIHRDKYKGGKK